jgi:PAS domain S-box-containing protein
MQKSNQLKKNTTEEIAASEVREGEDDYILEDRLQRLPNSVLNTIEKYQFEKERKHFIDEALEKEVLSKELLGKLSTKFLLATQVAGIGIWEYCLRQNKFFAEEVLFSLYGITAADFDGSYNSWRQFIHPADQERVHQEFHRATLKTSDFATEFRIVWQDGSVHFIKAVGIVQRDDCGSPTRIVGVNQDITANKEAERVIIESEAKYRSLFENSIDGILLSVTDGQILAANPAACTMFKMSEEEICKGGRFALVDVTDTRLFRLLEERQRTGKAKGETTFIRGDGSKFPGEVTSVLFKDACGEVRTSMVIRDITERRVAEEKQLLTSQCLQNALGEHKKIMDSSLDVICSFGEEGRFINVSSAAFTIWGYQPEELIGRKYIDMVWEADVDKTAETSRLIMSGAPVTMFENRYVHKEGHLVPMLWSARWDDTDKVTYCIAKNATEKKALEKALENERLRYYEVFKQVPSAIAILKGNDHCFEMVNPFYMVLTGKKDIIGKTVKEAMPEVENQGYINLLDNVFNSGECFIGNEMEVKLDKNGDGEFEKIYINFIYQPYKNSDGNVEGIFFFGNDVTEQVLSRKKVEESEKQFRQIVETAQEGIWMLDEHNRTRFVNSKMCGILEYTEEEMLGKHPYSFVKAMEQKYQQRYFSIGLQTNIDKYEDQFVTKSGKLVWVHLSTNPIFDERGNYKGALAMVTDVTERKRLEEKITKQKVQQQKEITKAALQVQEKERNFLGSELHDNINQILTAVKLHLAHYIQNPGTSMEVVEHSHEYLNMAIEEIRKLSHKLVTHRFDEDSFTESIGFLIRELPINKVVELEVTCLDENVIHESIKLTLFRIIQEQLNNIIKYAQATSVEIKIYNDTSEVHMQIKDNGVGFDPKQKGSGVGITNIHNRVESYNGKVKIESSPGQGCRLVLNVPLQQPLSALHLK